jgi:hypothetical protein
METARQNCQSISGLIAARRWAKVQPSRREAGEASAERCALTCTTVLVHLQIRRNAHWIGGGAGGVQYT